MRPTVINKMKNMRRHCAGRIIQTTVEANPKVVVVDCLLKYVAEKDVKKTPDYHVLRRDDMA